MAVCLGIAFIILLGNGSLGAPRNALAQTPTPTPTPDATPTEEPSPAPSPTPSPKPKPDSSPKPDSPKPDPSPEPMQPANDREPSGRHNEPLGERDSPGRKHRGSGFIFLDPDTPSTGLFGSFDTDKLVATSEYLQQLGALAPLQRRAFAPFIIGGRAEWTNSWGAPRSDGGSRIIRAHEGQDVFCDRGAPVLAATKGEIEFDNDSLGGEVARLHVSDGGYLYYAHLEGFNTNRFDSGDRVRPGDVIGYCGSSGNAGATAPHVHFGWYRRGVAHDPMALLVGWLETAERNARRLIRIVERMRLERLDTIMLARRFGDAWAPDVPVERNDRPATVDVILTVYAFLS